MSTASEQIKEYINSHRQEMLDKLKEFINLEGQTDQRNRFSFPVIWTLYFRRECLTGKILSA